MNFLKKKMIGMRRIGKMVIIYNDGGILECNTIEFYGSDLYVDEYRIVSIDDVERIEA